MIFYFVIFLNASMALATFIKSREHWVFFVFSIGLTLEVVMLALPASFNSTTLHIIIAIFDFWVAYFFALSTSFTQKLLSIFLIFEGIYFIAM